MLRSRESVSRIRMFHVAAISALMVLLAAELLLSIGHLSQTADEGAHLYAGYQHWRAHDFGVNPEHPPLVKLVAAAPLLGMQLQQPQPPNPFFYAEEYMGGDQLLDGNDADRLLRLGRTAVTVFPLLLALLVFAAGAEMFGPDAGLLGMALFAFEPTVLAHGALVTTDMGVTMFVFASVYAFYRYVKRPGVGRLVLLAFAVGFALATKMSGVIVLPILVVCACVELWRERGPWRAVQLLGAIAIAAAGGYVVLWAFYGFRYTARPAGLTLMPPLAPFAMLLPKAIHAPILFLARWHLLPEAYLYGWTKLPVDQVTHPMFLLGKVYATGVWYYFPVALAIKSSLTLLVLTVAAPLMFLRGLRPFRRERTFLLVPLAMVLAASMTSHLDIGVRHVLPMYPFAAVLGGAAASMLLKSSRAARYTVAALLLFQVVSSLHAFPDYLPYANEAFGGSGRAYRMLSDSNVDWGQELKEVGAYVREHSGEHPGEHAGQDCWFAYSLPTIPLTNYGISCKPLPTGFALWVGFPQAAVPRRITGTVLLGAMDATGVMWGNGEMNPYGQFRDRRPDAMIGNTVLVYQGSFDVPLAAAEARYSGVPMLLRQGRVEEGVAEARAAAALAPGSAQMEAKLGGALKGAHRGGEAEVCFAEARRMATAHGPDEAESVGRMIAGFDRPMF